MSVLLSSVMLASLPAKSAEQEEPVLSPLIHLALCFLRDAPVLSEAHPAVRGSLGWRFSHLDGGLGGKGPSHTAETVVSCQCRVVADGAAGLKIPA